jgi:class 3 adenylate cyclase
MVRFLKPLPLPDDPRLAACASAVNDAGFWASVMDRQWRIVFLTDELRLSLGDTGDSTAFPIGSHFYSAEAVRYRTAHFGGSLDGHRAGFRELGPYTLANTPGGREELRRIVAPELADMVHELHPQDMPVALHVRRAMTYAGTDVGTSVVWLRIDHSDGRLAGVCHVSKPAVGMSQLAAAAATADLAHLERMRIVEHPDRRQVAILMADLEASSPLARRLSTAQYFAFTRRLVRAADQCIIDAGGIVGRHAGDGIVAYFLAETAGSESAAARACITAAATLRSVLGDIAARSDIAVPDLSLRFGLHWGATLYMGRVLSAGRSEVTALGDEMNEAARIEGCATGGRSLASKALIERLDREDAIAVGIDPAHTAYTQLGQLDGATEKARRDAPSIPVCDITRPGL